MFHIGAPLLALACNCTTWKPLNNTNQINRSGPCSLPRSLGYPGDAPFRWRQRPLHHALSNLPQFVPLVTRPFQTAGCGTGQWAKVGSGESFSTSMLHHLQHHSQKGFVVYIPTISLSAQFGCERTDTRQGDLDALVPPRKTPVSKHSKQTAFASVIIPLSLSRRCSEPSDKSSAISPTDAIAVVLSAAVSARAARCLALSPIPGC